ncbi:hypothetical protein E2C01_069793 [Portunus trituberculatus]|uniref:Uncharacterized protein n=1 Tax=Portunus trituberculatus TaxID=210409 RepID=A0A5B7I0D3_PORTR|nr:hypothetical protein [Portunus trituberculatus]
MGVERESQHLKGLTDDFARPLRWHAVAVGGKGEARREQEAESLPGLEELPAEGSVRAEPIVAVSQDPGNQSLDRKDGGRHAESSIESGKIVVIVIGVIVFLCVFSFFFYECI